MPTSSACVGIGFGKLGQACADQLSKIGFNVIGWKRTPGEHSGYEGHHGQEGLTSFCSRADIVVVLLPSTKSTRNHVFGHMRQGSALINVGRGDLVVEEDLLEALDEETSTPCSTCSGPSRCLLHIHSGPIRGSSSRHTIRARRIPRRRCSRFQRTSGAPSQASRSSTGSTRRQATRTKDLDEQRWRRRQDGILLGRALLLALWRVLCVYSSG